MACLENMQVLEKILRVRTCYYQHCDTNADNQSYQRTG